MRDERWEMRDERWEMRDGMFFEFTRDRENFHVIDQIPKEAPIMPTLKKNFFLSKVRFYLFMIVYNNLL